MCSERDGEYFWNGVTSARFSVSRHMVGQNLEEEHYILIYKRYIYVLLINLNPLICIVKC